MNYQVDNELLKSIIKFSLNDVNLFTSGTIAKMISWQVLGILEAPCLRSSKINSRFLFMGWGTFKQRWFKQSEKKKIEILSILN